MAKTIAPRPLDRFYASRIKPGIASLMARITRVPGKKIASTAQVQKLQQKYSKFEKG